MSLRRLLLLLGLSLAVAPASGAQSPLQGPAVLATGLGDATVPGLSSTGVAFRDYRDSTYGVYYVGLASGQERRVAELFYAEVDVANSGNRLAWVGYPTWTQADVFVFDLASGATTRLTRDAAYQNHPRMHGDLLVWQDYRNAWASGTNADIYLHDFATGTTAPVTTDPGLQDLPAVWGRRVVWQDYRHADTTFSTADVYLLDLDAGGERRLTSGPAYRTYPAIWEHLVVWEDYRNGPRGDIYLYDLETGQERAVSTYPAHKTMPAVYGDWVLWLDYRDDPYHGNIYGFNLKTGEEYALLDHPAHQEPPELHGDVVVWQDYRDNRLDLYRATLGGVTTDAEADPAGRGRAIEMTAAPNPFGASTRITIPPELSRGSLEVFDVVGRRVFRSGLGGRQVVEWAGEDGLGRPLPNGLYVVRAASEGASSSVILVVRR